MSARKNNEYKDRITPKNKRLKNGKTHPWRSRGATTKQLEEDRIRNQQVISFTANMGVK